MNPVVQVTENGGHPDGRRAQPHVHDQAADEDVNGTKDDHDQWYEVSSATYM